MCDKTASKHFKYQRANSVKVKSESLSTGGYQTGTIKQHESSSNVCPQLRVHTCWMMYICMSKCAVMHVKCPLVIDLMHNEAERKSSGR